jgi:hypothetical protein
MLQVFVSLCIPAERIIYLSYLVCVCACVRAYSVCVCVCERAYVNENTFSTVRLSWHEGKLVPQTLHRVQGLEELRYLTKITPPHPLPLPPPPPPP